MNWNYCQWFKSTDPWIFSGRRSSAGSRLFELLLGSCLLSAGLQSSCLSGFGHRGSPVFLANFTLHHGSLGMRKNRRDDRWAAVTKAKEGKRTKEPHWEGGSHSRRRWEHAMVGESAETILESFFKVFVFKKKLRHLFWGWFGCEKIKFWRKNDWVRTFNPLLLCTIFLYFSIECTVPWNPSWLYSLCNPLWPFMTS